MAFFAGYWTLSGNLKLQNLFILAGSYLFYGWWDWRFLSLLIGSSLVNYYLGLAIARSRDEINRKYMLYIGVLTGLATLAFFKYYNFFVVNFIDVFGRMGINLHLQTLQLILPLGISFYTFRTISYLLDVDKGKIQPSADWVVFFAYVSFSPA